MSHVRSIYKEAYGGEDPPLYFMLTNNNFKTSMLEFYSSMMSVLIMGLKFIIDFPEYHSDALKEVSLDKLKEVISHNKAYVRDIYPKKSSGTLALTDFFLGSKSTDQKDKEIKATTLPFEKR